MSSIIPKFVRSHRDRDDVNDDYRQHRISYQEILRKTGNDHFEKGNLQEALAYYTLAIEDEPTTQAYSNRALVYLQYGKPELAFLDASEAVELDGTNWKALYRKGLALAQLGRHKSAIRELEKCEKMEIKDSSGKNEVEKLLDRQYEQVEKDEDAAKKRRPYRMNEPCNHPGLGCAAKSAHTQPPYYWTAKEKIWEEGEHTTLWTIIVDQMGIGRGRVKKPDWVITEFNQYTKGNVEISLLAKSTEAFQCTLDNFQLAKRAFGEHKLEIIPDSQLSPLEGLRHRLTRFLDVFSNEGFPIVVMYRYFRGLLRHRTILNSPWLRLMSPRMGTAPFDLDEIMDWLHIGFTAHKGFSARFLQITSEEPKMVEENLAKKIYKRFHSDQSKAQTPFVVIFDCDIDFNGLQQKKKNGGGKEFPLKFPVDNEVTGERMSLEKIGGGLFSGFYALARFPKEDLVMPYDDRLLTSACHKPAIQLYW